MIILRLFTIIVLAILIHDPAVAQSEGNEQEGSLLPDINPQDIEIRSEFQARFPGLRRQPILGFNPKPRVFRVDPNRMPFMESRDDAVAGIEITDLDRPEPPQRELLSTPGRKNTYLRVGGGSYYSPELDFYFLSGLNDRNLVSSSLHMRASDGHLEEQQGEFRYIDANVHYVSKLQDDLKLSVDVGALSDYNKMFQLENALQNMETANKDYIGAGSSIELEKIRNSLEGWKFTAGGNIFSVDLHAENGSLGGEINELAYHASFSNYWAGNRIYETFDITGSVEGGSYESTDNGAEQWIDAKASLEYRRLLNFNTHISGKGSIEYISDAFSDKIYFVPELELQHNLRDAVVITGKAYAKPEIQSVQDHHQYNRFLNTRSQIKHSYKAGTMGEIAFQPIEGNRIFGGISFDYVRDYAFYRRSQLFSNADDVYGFYDVNYEDATVFQIFAGITQQLVPEKFWFDAKIYGRNPSLNDGGKIPYEERLGLEGSLSFKPVEKLTVNSWAEYIGKRADPLSEGDLSSFALINGSAEFQINEKFGVYAKVLNILGQKYEIWNGYQERPFQVFGGLTLKL